MDICELEAKVYFKVIKRLINYFGGNENFVIELSRNLGYRFTKDGELIRD